MPIFIGSMCQITSNYKVLQSLHDDASDAPMSERYCSTASDSKLCTSLWNCIMITAMLAARHQLRVPSYQRVMYGSHAFAVASPLACSSYSVLEALATMYYINLIYSTFTLYLPYIIRGDYSSGHQNNSLCAIYPVTGTLAIRLFVRSNENEAKCS